MKGTVKWFNAKKYNLTPFNNSTLGNKSQRVIL